MLPIPAPDLDCAPLPDLAAMARRWRQGLRQALRIAGALAVFSTAAPAQPVCRGNDLLPDLAQSQPALHARILETVRREPNGEALLWKITDPKQTQPEPKVSWLLGTIHLTDTRVHALSPAIQEALASAKVLALEVDDIGPKAMQKAFSQNEKLLAPREGRPLDKLLTAAELASLRTISAKLGLPVGQALLMRPWFLTTLMSLPACESARQEAGFKPLDSYLQDRAIAHGARVVGLETIADQLKAMASLPLETELAWLRAAISLYPRIEDMTETLLQLYLRRRIGATWELSQAMSGPLAFTPEQLSQVQQALVVGRNRKMRDAALPLLAKGSTFIGVGALHLPGRDGLVQLLREKGYAVTAVE
jgi:uncharacterized protein